MAIFSSLLPARGWDYGDDSSRHDDDRHGHRHDHGDHGDHGHGDHGNGGHGGHGGGHGGY
ncbi:hypothetical protein ACWD5V_23405 [Streptomyces sp. NPDC002523]